MSPPAKLAQMEHALHVQSLAAKVVAAARRWRHTCTKQEELDAIDELARAVNDYEDALGPAPKSPAAKAAATRTSDRPAPLPTLIALRDAERFPTRQVSFPAMTVDERVLSFIEGIANLPNPRRCPERMVYVASYDGHYRVTIERVAPTEKVFAEDRAQKGREHR